jgi:hypothetical protein
MIMSQKLPWIQWRYVSLKNEMELRTVVRRIWAVLCEREKGWWHIQDNDEYIDESFSREGSAYRIAYTLRTNCIRMSIVPSATIPPN